MKGSSQAIPEPADSELPIGLDALIRSVGINHATPHALLLGAGASISSGVPSAAAASSCVSVTDISRRGYAPSL